MTEPEVQEQWVKMGDAAKELGVKQSKLSRMAKQGKIKHKSDPYDFRVNLVDIVELRKIFTR